MRLPDGLVKKKKKTTKAGCQNHSRDQPAPRIQKTMQNEITLLLVYKSSPSRSPLWLQREQEEDWGHQGGQNGILAGFPKVKEKKGKGLLLHSTGGLRNQLFLRIKN